MSLIARLSIVEKAVLIRALHRLEESEMIMKRVCTRANTQEERIASHVQHKLFLESLTEMRELLKPLFQTTPPPTQLELAMKSLKQQDTKASK